MFYVKKIFIFFFFIDLCKEKDKELLLLFIKVNLVRDYFEFLEEEGLFMFLDVIFV